MALDGMDVIQVPGYPGLFARRTVVDMWRRAGSPWIIVDHYRLYSLAHAQAAGL